MSKEKLLRSWLEESGEPSGEEIKCYAVTFTPKVAQMALDCMGKNRPLKAAIVQRYARDMESGAWALTGEPIIFDSDMSMRNGQHRCAAYIRSGEEFRTLVVTGVHPKAFDRMDQQCKRSCADVFSIKGEMGTNHLTACCVLLWHWECSRFKATGSHRIMPSISEVEDVLERHPDIRNFRKSYADREHGMRCSDSVLATLHYILSGIDRERADAFFDGIKSGDGVPTGDARKALRERLIRDSVRGINRRPQELLGLVIKAWNAWYSGKKISVLVWRGLGEEEFPMIEGAA